jgi:hypothetical protein
MEEYHIPCTSSTAFLEESQHFGFFRMILSLFFRKLEKRSLVKKIIY